MQPQVDDQFLSAMGLDGLEGEAKQKALDDILYTLNMRVGERVSEILNEDQLDEFEKLSDDADEAQLAQWLEQNVPTYKQIIEEEAQKMKDQTDEIDRMVFGGKET